MFLLTKIPRPFYSKNYIDNKFYKIDHYPIKKYWYSNIMNDYKHFIKIINLGYAEDISKNVKKIGGCKLNYFDKYIQDNYLKEKILFSKENNIALCYKNNKPYKPIFSASQHYAEDRLTRFGRFVFVLIIKYQYYIR